MEISGLIVLKARRIMTGKIQESQIKEVLKKLLTEI